MSMIHKLHETLKKKDKYAVSISLWPIDEVDIIIRDQSDPYDDPRVVLRINEEDIGGALIKAIAFLE